MSSPAEEAEAFKAKLRSLSFGKVPGGARREQGVRRPQLNNGWERGVLTESRPGGGQMPVLDPDNDYKPIRLKEAGERRHEIQERLAQQRVTNS